MLRFISNSIKQPSNRVFGRLLLSEVQEVHRRIIQHIQSMLLMIRDAFAARLSGSTRAAAVRSRIRAAGSLARAAWLPGIPDGGEGCFTPFGSPCDRVEWRQERAGTSTLGGGRVYSVPVPSFWRDGPWP